MFWSTRETLTLIDSLKDPAGVNLVCTATGNGDATGDLAQFTIFSDEDPALMREFAMDLALVFAREKDPGQITELEKARARYREYVIPEWFLTADDN